MEQNGTPSRGEALAESPTPGPLNETSKPDIYLLNSATEHTMPNVSLERYLKMKFHEDIEKEIRSGKWKEIHIIVEGSCNWRSDDKIVSKKEKPGKLGDWMRPTLTYKKLCNSTALELKLHVFPGHDYVYHYACVVKNYIHLFVINQIIRHKPIITVKYVMPTEEDCARAIRECGFREAVEDESLAVKDAICVIGIVDRLTESANYDCRLESEVNNFLTSLPKESSSESIKWTDRTFFSWCEGKVQRKNVVLICIKFSIWSDIGGRVVKQLGQLGCKKVLYIGKVGGLHEDMVPNTTFVTGTNSFVRDSHSLNVILREMKWRNTVSHALNRQINNYEQLRNTVHYNSPSILLEDKAWMSKLKTNTTNKEMAQVVGIVDPEIGSMAMAAQSANVEFGYLHLVSNNLEKVYESDLGNERSGESPEQRKNAYREMLRILITAIQDIVD